MSLRLESDFVARFLAGIRVGVYALETRIVEPVIVRRRPDYIKTMFAPRPNPGLVATPFLQEFPVLRLEHGWRLMCLYTEYPDERFSRLLVARGQPDSDLAPVPSTLEHAAFWGSHEPLPELPQWVSWDI